jgi:exopolyphosphatase / guanosine-5'-triphosphate,3'-diphosphate pyrophosphatase
MRVPENHMRVGAIDVGSNSIRLLVADIRSDGEPGELVTVARAGEPCRLGRGLGETGAIDAEMAERATAVAGEFARRARSLGAIHTIVGATAALRRAENGVAVAGAIANRIGMRVRILSGHEEARLVYQAVVLGLRSVARRSPCVVFDLGGGSTEVVSGLGPEAGRWVSLPFGAVSLTEKFIRSNPVGEEEVSALSDQVRKALMHECAYMPDATPVFAGVGGTVTVLASLDRDLSAYEPAMIEGWVIDSGRLEELIQRVAYSTEEKRKMWPILGQGRSDLMVAGALVIRLLAERFPSRGLVCSTQGLRYGLARLAAAEAVRGSNATGAEVPEA